jgi:hypothetical protein
VTWVIGAVLHPDDAVASKLAALYGRAEYALAGCVTGDRQLS